MLLSDGPLFPAANPSVRAPWRDTSRGVAVLARLDLPDGDEACRQAVADAGGGADGIILVFSGAAGARGFGLSPDSADLDRLFECLAPSRLALRCEWPALRREALVDRVLAAAEKHGVVPRLDLAADPLGEAGPPTEAAVKAARHAATLRERGHPGPSLHVDGRPHHETGASEAEELAAVLSTGVAYLRALEGARLAFDRAIRFTLAADVDANGTIAKLRAFRRLWARVLEACGLAPVPVAVTAETSWRMLSRADAWTNIPRGAVAAAAAILGGADAVSVLPFTSALGLPDPAARRLARNTPLVLLEEAHLGRVADPCAGSGAFEALTDALCREAWDLFRGLEASGGLPAALASGAWQARMTAARVAREAALAVGERTIVGVTAFFPGDELPPPVLERMAAKALKRENGVIPAGAKRRAGTQEHGLI